MFEKNYRWAKHQDSAEKPEKEKWSSFEVAIALMVFLLFEFMVWTAASLFLYGGKLF